MNPPTLTNRERKELKSRAQRLDTMVKIGRNGLSDSLLQSVDEALAHHELVKVKFDDFKEQKHELAPQLAEKTSSALVTVIGHVAVLYRKKPEPAKES